MVVDLQPDFNRVFHTLCQRCLLGTHRLQQKVLKKERRHLLLGQTMIEMYKYLLRILNIVELVSDADDPVWAPETTLKRRAQEGESLVYLGSLSLRFWIGVVFENL